MYLFEYGSNASWKGTHFGWSLPAGQMEDENRPVSRSAFVNAKMKRARNLAGLANLCNCLKFSALMTSFISYNLRFQISPFAIRSCSERMSLAWTVTRYAREGERDLGGQSADLLHDTVDDTVDTVHDECTTTPRAREVIVNMAPGCGTECLQFLQWLQ